MAPIARIDFAALMPAVARALLGEPNARMSTAREFRYGSRGSLSVHLDKGTWHDFETAAGGGVLDLVARERGCSRADALRWLREHGFVDVDPALTRPESRCEPRPGDVANATAPEADTGERIACVAPRRDTRAGARRVWNATRPLAGTVAARYLAAHGVAHVAGNVALRFHSALSHPTAPGRFPCLVAGIQDVAGQFLGIQRTYLAADGTGKAAVDPVRASLGSLAGGAVRLAEPAGGRLLVGEGIETTAAAVLVLDWHGGAWATLGTSGLRALEFPECVRDVVIATDRDAAGLRAAAALAERLEGQGRAVEIRAPCRGDFADWLSEATS